MHSLTQKLIRGLVIAGLSIGTAFAADMNSPIGTWKTIDDATGKQKGLVQITEAGGVYSGKVLKTFRADKPNPICEKCDGDLKNKPVIGMTFLWDLKKDGEEFEGGKILDPENGKVYKAKMKLIEGGKKLEVRGFIGFSLIGRSQVWVREE